MKPIKNTIFPLYKLSWFADLKIRRKIKQAFKTEAQNHTPILSPSLLTLCLRPQYALALSSLCLVFGFSGYLVGHQTATPLSPQALQATPAVQTMAVPTTLSIEPRGRINPYQNLLDNAHQITETFGHLKHAHNPEEMLAELKIILALQAQTLDSQIIRSPQMELLFQTHLSAYQALYEKLITLEDKSNIANALPPKLMIVEDQLTSEFNYNLETFSIESWLAK